jgi:hypothetical protein
VNEVEEEEANERRQDLKAEAQATPASAYLLSALLLYGVEGSGGWVAWR